jgi:probable F420-dependent oxidoreductase
MRFATAIPQHVRDEFDDAAFRAHLGRAEELGFESAWAQEQVLGTGGVLSPLQAMTYAAACTDRLRLGCAVLVSPLHNPLQLAKAVSSLDCLSRGRIEIGLGTGGRGRPFAAFGIDPDGLVTRFNEGVALMKACWTEPRITFNGRFWQMDGVAMEPKPAQKPHPPIWIGGSHPAALGRAVRIGDGFFGAGSASTAQFAEQAQTIREELVEQDRDPQSFRIAKRVYVHVDDDSARARDQIESALEHHYGRPMPGIALAGPPSECIEGLATVAAAGAEMILLNPLLDDTAQMERLAAEVIPALA